MIGILREIVHNLVVIILLTTFLDMLLPNNNMQRFIKVVMGLFIMITILNPIIVFLNRGMEINSWSLSLPYEEKVDTVFAQGEEFARLQDNQIKDEYKKGLEQQIQVIVSLIPEVKDVSCQLEMVKSDRIGSIGEIKKVNLNILLEEQDLLVKPVESVTLSPQNNKKVDDSYDGVKKKIINIVSNYYNLPENYIDINLK